MTDIKEPNEHWELIHGLYRSNLRTAEQAGVLVGRSAQMIRRWAREGLIVSVQETYHPHRVLVDYTTLGTVLDKKKRGVHRERPEVIVTENGARLTMRKRR
jgi:hypothetical protein